MDNILVALVILAIVALAGYYIYRAKKKGARCVGCPDSGACSGNCGSCGGCPKQDTSHL